ncbi:MAG: 2-C-methyl-D-erythritol 4-phosphate cytidylyltransferase [Thiothrix nivea]|nr:MAG: 2-C-methyl-D-erythritol 4-phosphate cytidylyltransferase [Thiothrix nivea]
MPDKTTNKPVWVVIPAAGAGQRMQMDCPKQYLQLHDKTVLEHTLNIFLGITAISGIVVVTSAGDEYWPEIAEKLQGFPVHQTDGGKERADSVLNGLNYLHQQQVPADAVVLVHDAARPCLSSRDLRRLLAMVDSCADNGAILATPVHDTMKRAQAGQQPVQIAHTESRDHLWHALTPQMARLEVLQDALSRGLAARAAITDEASALEFVGLHPYLLEGESSNIKITRPADLALAGFFLQQRLAEKEV